MKKLALTPENLQVQSFDTTPGRVATRGTVIGNSGPYETNEETCDGSCFPCEFTPACNTDRRGPC